MTDQQLARVFATVDKGNIVEVKTPRGNVSLSRVSDYHYELTLVNPYRVEVLGRERAMNAVREWNAIEIIAYRGRPW